MIKPVCILQIILLAFSSCEPKVLTLSDLKTFLADEGNGLTKRTLKNNLETTLSYRPTDLIIASNHRKDVKDKNAADSIGKIYDRYLYFTLKLSDQGKELEHKYLYSKTAFAEAVSYLTNSMAQDIQLITLPQKDTFNVVDYIYPRMYAATGATTVMFAFDRSALQNSQSFQILHQSKKFGLSINIFHFTVDDITNLPKIDLSKSTN